MATASLSGLTCSFWGGQLVKCYGDTVLRSLCFVSKFFTDNCLVEKCRRVKCRSKEGAASIEIITGQKQVRKEKILNKNKNE